jgi:hypothetical protein
LIDKPAQRFSGISSDHFDKKLFHLMDDLGTYRVGNAFVVNDLTIENR